METTRTNHRPASNPVFIDCNGIPFPAFIARSDSETVEINQQFAALFHRQPESSREMSISDLDACLGSDIGSAVCTVARTNEPFVIEDARVEFVSCDHGCASIHLVPLAAMRGESDCDCMGIIVDRSGQKHLEHELNLVQSELSIVSQVGAQLGSMMETEEIFKIILIGVTAREGLGFNRAFILLMNDEQSELIGHHAIGPMDAEEAGRIWGSIPDEGKDLRSIIRTYRRSINLEDVPLDLAVKSIEYSIAEDVKNPIVMAATERACLKVSDQCELAAISEGVNHLYGRTELAVAPLLSKNAIRGVIIADNMITNRPIADSDVEQLQLFASQAAIAIDRARLYENLQSNVEKLENTNLQLERTQQQMISMERLSLMGEMTYRIAHEFRNPLTIIGGFACLLLKSGEMAEASRERAEVIRNECRRIERLLDTLLDFSRSYSQDMEDVDLNLMATDIEEMTQARFTDSGVTIRPVASDSPVIVNAHKEQLLHGVFTIVSVLIEDSPSGATWLLSAIADDKKCELELKPEKECIDRDEAVAVIGRFFRGQAGSGDLRLSLANEAITYNGGELAFWIDGDHPRVNITFES